MTAIDRSAQRLQMGRVVKQTFSVVGENIGAFLLLSIVPSLAAVAGNIAAVRFPDISAILWFAAWGLIYFASAMLLQGGVTHGAVASFNGTRGSFSDCLATGLKYLWPLFLIGLLATLGIIAGVALLIVPGIILFVMWVAACPACVLEHTGVSGAFSRSVELTRGYRWPIFGLAVASIILMFVFEFVAGLLIGVVIGIGAVISSSDPAAAVAAATTNANMAQLIVSGVTTMLALIIISALCASIYYELRQIKEGIGPETLASVFD